MDSLQYATHCQHTTARHITELLLQSIRCSPTHSHCQNAVHKPAVRNCTIPQHRHCSLITGEFRKIHQHNHIQICWLHVAFKYLLSTCWKIRHRVAHHPCHCTQLTVQEWQNVLRSESHGIQQSTVYK